MKEPEKFIKDYFEHTHYRVYNFRLNAWRYKLGVEGGIGEGQKQIKKLVKSFDKLECIEEKQYPKFMKALKNDWEIVRDMAFYFDSKKAVEFAKYYAKNCQATQEDKNIFQRVVNEIETDSAKMKLEQKAKKMVNSKQKPVKEEKNVEVAKKYNSLVNDINDDILFTE